METRFPKDMKATLKSIREMRGYKQEEAAKLIGIATDTLIFLPLDFGLTEIK